MFPVTTKSKHMFFVKIEAFLKLPNEILSFGNNAVNYPNPEEEDEAYESDSGEVIDTPASLPSTKSIFICCSLLIEDQISNNLELHKVGIFSKKYLENNYVTGDLPIINLSSKTSAVKGGVL